MDMSWKHFIDDIYIYSFTNYVRPDLVITGVVFTKTFNG